MPIVAAAIPPFSQFQLLDEVWFDIINYITLTVGVKADISMTIL